MQSASPVEILAPIDKGGGRAMHAEPRRASVRRRQFVRQQPAVRKAQIAFAPRERPRGASLFLPLPNPPLPLRVQSPLRRTPADIIPDTHTGLDEHTFSTPLIRNYSSALANDNVFSLRGASMLILPQHLRGHILSWGSAA